MPEQRTKRRRRRNLALLERVEADADETRSPEPAMRRESVLRKAIAPTPSCFDALVATEEQQLLRSAMASIDPRRALALSLRLCGRTWWQVGRAFGVSVERARQIACRGEREVKWRLRQWRVIDA